MLRWIWENLRQSEAEHDAAFQQEIGRLSLLGLQVIGGVAVTVPVFMILVLQLVGRVSSQLGTYLLILGEMATGIAAAVLGRQKWARPYARRIGLTAGFLVGAQLMWASLLRAPVSPGSERFIVTQISVVMLIALVSLPMHPLQTLLLGSSLFVFHGLSSHLALELGLLPEIDSSRVESVFLSMLTLLSTALSAAVYRRLYSDYASHRRELRAAEELRNAQSHAFLAENAASMGRLAAALSHELNSPVGALKSAISSLGVLAAKRAKAPEEQRERLNELEAELQKTARESAERLHDIVARMQRFTNLDRAEVQAVDLNRLLLDVKHMVESESPGSFEVRVDLHPLQPVVCRPQQLSAVFSNLLHGAIKAADGAGEVVLTTRQPNGHVEIQIHDKGKALTPEELKGIFDPGFRVSGNRVASGNWRLFSARGVIREHGGDIRIESEAGRGTTVSVTLPVGGERDDL